MWAFLINVTSQPEQLKLKQSLTHSHVGQKCTKYKIYNDGLIGNT